MSVYYVLMSFLIVFAIALVVVIIASYYYFFVRPEKAPDSNNGARTLTIGNVALRLKITGYSVTQSGSLYVSGVPIGANPFATLVGRPVLISTKSLGVVHSTIVKKDDAASGHISFNTADNAVPATSKGVFQGGDFALIR